MAVYNASKNINLIVGQSVTLTLDSNGSPVDNGVWNNQNANLGTLTVQSNTSATFTADVVGTATVTNTWNYTYVSGGGGGGGRPIRNINLSKTLSSTTSNNGTDTFTITISAAPVPTVVLSATTTSLYTNGTGTPTNTAIHTTANGADVTSSAVYSGTGSSYVSSGVFGPAPAGTYGLTASYGGGSSGNLTITVQAGATPPPPPTTPSTTTENLVGYAVAALYQPIQQAPQCNILVASQINVFFGDGRHGYIPANTRVGLAPGQYWIGQFTESLDPSGHPVIVPSQQMINFPYFAEAVDISSQMYNIGALQTDGNGGYTRTYSIFLGVCDSVSGNFQSPWDLVAVSFPADNEIPAQPPCGHGMFLSAKSKITVEDYAKKKLKKHQPIEVSEEYSRPTAQWVGSASYNKNTLIINSISFYNLNNETNVFESVFKKENLSFKMNKNSMLVAIPTSSGSWEIQSLSVNANLFESSHTYVLGVVTDKFYSAWSMFHIASKININDNEISPMMREIIKRMKDNK
jgi:hypothetical protein